MISSRAGLVWLIDALLDPGPCADKYAANLRALRGELTEPAAVHWLDALRGAISDLTILPEEEPAVLEVIGRIKAEAVAEMRPTVVARDATAEAPAVVRWCPQCGPEPKCDGDGCCVTCGCDTGEVPDWRVLQRERDEVADTSADLEAIRSDLHRQLAEMEADRRKLRAEIARVERERDDVFRRLDYAQVAMDESLAKAEAAVKRAEQVEAGLAEAQTDRDDWAHRSLESDDDRDIFARWSRLYHTRCRELRREVRTALLRGFEIAEDSAEVSESDGWHKCDPFIDWSAARSKLETALGRGEGGGT